MANKLSHYKYTNNILRDAKSMHNILKSYTYIENIIRDYLNLLSLHQYIDAMTIYCSLFYLMNTVFNLLNIHIYTVNISQGSHNIVHVLVGLDEGCHLWGRCLIRGTFVSRRGIGAAMRKKIE